MDYTQLVIYKWPDPPPLPLPGMPILIRIATPSLRQAARLELRTVLRTVLASWSGLPQGQLPLAETKSGPVWLGLVGGSAIAMSLSYSGGEGWIGLIRGGSIGVDAMCIQHIPEIEEMARHYLDPPALTAIRRSPDPDAAFAEAWTGLEARLKCLKLGLKEWNDESTAIMMTKCDIQCIVLTERIVVSVATIPLQANTIIHSNACPTSHPPKGVSIHG